MLVAANTVGRLGRLQKTILKIALHNREAEGRTGCEDQGADVLITEAMISHLGLDLSVLDEEGKRIYSARIIDVEKVGKTRYSDAKAAVRASVRGLEKRGLIFSVRGLTGWAGANLSDQGLHVAKILRAIGVNGNSARPAREREYSGHCDEVPIAS